MRTTHLGISPMARLPPSPAWSLADFAKLVELFDAHGVSSISVT